MANSNNDVKITIVTEDKSKATVKKIDSDFKNLLTTFAKVTAGAAAIGYAAKKIYDFGKAGAEIDYTRDKFDKLAESIGTTGDALRMDLSNATQGMLSDAELMAGAGDLMALGLARTRDEAARLTTVASALGMNMNQLVLTLTNQTTMRFDALGVSVAGFDEKVEALKKTGMSASDAFGEAFLQQAEAQLELVGNKADTAAGEYQKLEVKIKNATDAMKVQASDGITPLVASTADFITVEIGLNKAVEEGIITLQEANDQRAAFIFTSYEAADAQNWLKSKTDEYNASLGLANQFAAAQTETVKELGSETSITAGMTRDFADDMYEGENAARAMGAALATDTKKTKELRGALDELMGLDTSFFSTIASTLDKIDWKKAGGGDIEKAVDSASNAFDTGKITIDEYEGILDKAALAALTVEGNIDDLNNIEIAEHLHLARADAIDAVLDGTDGAVFDGGRGRERLSGAVRVGLQYGDRRLGV